MTLDTKSVAQALHIVDDVWEEQRGSPYTRIQLGVVPDRLPDVSFAEAQRRGRVGVALLRRMDALEPGAFPHDLELTLRLARSRANTWSRAAEWYWSVIDPLGVGSFGMFLPTAYCGGMLLDTVHSQLGSYRFKSQDDCDRYLILVSDYARLIDQYAERTLGQAQRDIYMPVLQVQQARALFMAFKSRVRQTLAVAPQRLSAIAVGDFSREVEKRIAASVEPAFDRMLGVFTDSYLARAPQAVGLGQYIGGVSLYAELVKLHTTLDLTPQQIHARGHECMAEIEASMSAIRRDLGFKGDGVAFLAHIHRDPRWCANTVEGVTEVFQNYLNRIKSRFGDYFSTAPRATYTVAPLPEALQASMTYGYYDSPRHNRSEGRYLFNASNLTKKSLFNIGSLTYHELMPGHHLHMATQLENEALHPFRKYSFVTAYNEGWAEYAATFAGEIGLYEQPEERYGRMVMEAFLICRLVIDTGMNALGWSLERSRTYMREHSGMTEGEIQTELLRYSCDIPGQALSYKVGEAHILSLRERMRVALGSRFDLKAFHTAILSPGALPLSDLKWHVEYETKKISEDCTVVGKT